MLTPRRTITFLPDIDGLRAFAVIAVVLFHLEVAGFDGGYVGVDIFFVISGFLITGLLRQRIEAGRFGFASFYAGRVSRLLPAVLATVAATSVAALFVLQPTPLAAFGQSALAAVFSVANILFFLESGYWDANAELKPLLHMWSLGVEEQFYLFWPALIVLLTRQRSRLYLPGLIGVLAVSLLACILYTPKDGAAAFYLLPFRVWQFALGALAAELWQRHSLPLFARQVLRSAGLALCVVCVVTLGDPTGFPGWRALLPSLGAAMVLIACHENDPSPVLANAVARWLGKVSYAMYLAHWPPIALWRSWTLAELTDGARFGLGALTLLLTVLLHYGVETRFYRRDVHRNSGWRGTPRAALATAMGLAAVLLVVVRFPDAAALRPAVLGTETIERYSRGRFELTAASCRIDKLDDPRRCPLPLRAPILFIGNSHEPDGVNLLDGALPGLPGHDLVVFGTVNRCANLRLEGDEVVADDPDCRARLSALASSLDTVAWDTVVYSARRPYADSKTPLLALLETMKQRQPELRLIVIEDYITTHHDCAALINQFGSSLACRAPDNVAFFPPGQPEVNTLYEPMRTIADHIISKVALGCDDGDLASCATSTPDGHPFAVDGHHLTREFARWLGVRLRDHDPALVSALIAPAESSVAEPSEN